MASTDIAQGTGLRFLGDGATGSRTALLREAVLRERSVPARADVLRQGEVPTVAHVLLEGHTCRYRTLADGRRQITAVLVPGDICDLEAVLTGQASYSVGALTDTRLGEIALGHLANVDDLEFALRQLLWRQLLRDEAIAREWILGLGRRSALERLAHLLCELWTRLREVGLAVEDGCELKFTQNELGDILGLSSVHVNRTIQALRATGLIELQNGTLHIFDHRGLAKLAGFDAGYLHALPPRAQ